MKHRKTRRAAVLLFALLVSGGALLGVPSPVRALDPTALQWWPPGVTDVSQGFHLRVPVTVRNPNAHSIENGLVLAEIDVRQELIAAGWVKEARGASQVLRSFEFDNSSVRVVAMTSLDTASGGSTAGLLRAYDTSYAASDPRRYEVPSRFYQGFLAGTSELQFDAKTNPTITVMWRVPGILAAGDERSFMVYFDSTTNGKHDPPDPTALLGGNLLDRSFWSGPGTDLLGFVTPTASQPGRVTVIGTRSGTSVSVLVANSAGLFALQAPTGLNPNPFPLGEGEVKDIFISNTQGTTFRLVSDRPILALVDSEGFVPSLAGENTGTDFLFATTYPATTVQDSLFVYNRNPTLAAAVVTLESLDDHTSTDVHLSDPTNNFPYTLGAHAGDAQPAGSQCTFPPTPEEVILPLGPHHYRAHVVSGGPVALQFQPVRGATPLPSANGSAYGTEFWSALSRSTATPQGGGCLRNLQQYATYATSLTAARLTLTSPEWPVQLSPACSGGSCPPGDPVGPFPTTMLSGKTFTTGDISDRPLRFRLDSPAWLMEAPATQSSLANVAVRGPLGGADGARVFAGLGPTDVYAPYRDTLVHATLQYASSGMTKVDLTLSAERLTPLPSRPGNDPLLWYSLASNRPILVLPRGAAPGFLAGIPPLLQATPHEADFRGYLIQLRSASGLDPVTSSTVPGAPAVFSFLVTNLGRGAGATNLADTVELSLSALPSGWTASLSRSAIRLATAETQAVDLRVVPPADAEPGQLARVTVTARSRSNPQVSDSVDAVVHVKRSFDIGIWFDQVDGPKAVTQTVSAENPGEYALVVQNRGTVRDTIALAYSSPDSGWQVSLLRGGVPVDGVALDPLETAPLTLRVTPPGDVAEGVLVTSVEARSLSSPAVLDRVAATTKLRAPSLLTLVMDNRTAWVDPGHEASFNLTLKNAGAGTTEVTVAVQFDRIPGWTDPRVALRGPDGATPTNISRISLGPGESLPLSIVTTAPPGSLASQRMSIRVSAISSSQDASVEDFLTAIVLPMHDLRVAPMGVLRFERGGVNQTFEMPITNQGNLEEFLQVAPNAVPAGWTLRPDVRVLVVPSNRTQVLRLSLTSPADAPEGSYNFTVALTSYDGNRTLIDLHGRVGAFMSDAVNGSATILAQPGRPAPSQFAFQNLGNVPVDVRIGALPGEPWTLVAGSAFVPVPPHATVALPLAWRVPMDAESGTTLHQAVLFQEFGTSGIASTSRTLEAEIAVGRPDLRILDARAFAGAAGWVVQARVGNDGLRDGFEVEVALAVGDEIVDHVVIRQVPPGTQENVSLLLPSGTHGPVKVLLDPDGRVPDSNRADDSFLLPALTDEAQHGVPSLGGPLLLAGLGAVALCRRRRERNS